jgi:hypothetical protein
LAGHGLAADDVVMALLPLLLHHSSGPEHLDDSQEAAQNYRCHRQRLRSLWCWAEGPGWSRKWTTDCAWSLYQNSFPGQCQPLVKPKKNVIYARSYDTDTPLLRIPWVVWRTLLHMPSATCMYLEYGNDVPCSPQVKMKHIGAYSTTLYLMLVPLQTLRTFLKSSKSLFWWWNSIARRCSLPSLVSSTATTHVSLSAREFLVASTVAVQAIGAAPPQTPSLTFVTRIFSFFLFLQAPSSSTLRFYATNR